MPKRSYRQLGAWEKAMDMAVEAYEVARALPNIERFALSEQLRRAAVSVPANIAEGYASNYKGDYLRSLSHAKGSVAEVETELQLTVRLRYVDEGLIRVPMGLADEVTRLITSIQRKLGAF